jgi:hypothetical protein
LLPTILYDVLFESDRIRDAGFENYTRISESNSRRKMQNLLHVSCRLTMIPLGKLPKLLIYS